MKNPVVKRWLRWVITAMGTAIGAGLSALAVRLWQLLARGSARVPQPTAWMLLAVYVVLTTLALILTFICAPRLIEGFAKLVNKIERRLDATPMSQVILGALGLLVGLGIAALVSSLYRFGDLTVLSIALSVLTYMALGYLGVSLATRRWKEFPLMTKRADRQRGVAQVSTSGIPPKILDTSVIIDGRIFDISKTGFVEGMLTIPQFVLDELRHIADSSDAMRRTRGRRGLDVLQRMQKELGLPIHIDDTDFDDTDEVDVKLLKLAQQVGGIVVTNDYNLNKVASVTGVKVLNINELANAVKPVVMHGEEMTVQVVREGKEPGQGVAYLDDGTMIVVDNGRRCVGETVEVVVTTVLQTAAGRMIFTKLKGMDKVG